MSEVPRHNPHEVERTIDRAEQLDKTLSLLRVQLEELQGVFKEMTQEFEQMATDPHLSDQQKKEVISAMDGFALQIGVLKEVETFYERLRAEHLSSMDAEERAAFFLSPGFAARNDAVSKKITALTLAFSELEAAREKFIPADEIDLSHPIIRPRDVEAQVRTFMQSANDLYAQLADYAIDTGEIQQMTEH